MTELTLNASSLIYTLMPESKTLVPCVAVIIGIMIGWFSASQKVDGYDSSWHWKRVNEYRQYINGEIDKTDYHGYTYHDGEPDILPSLHALEKAAELRKLDLVFPNVPLSPEVTKYWMEFCNATDGMIEGSANLSYSKYKTIGVQPFRMVIWFKPEIEDKVDILIAGIEEFGSHGKL